MSAEVFFIGDTHFGHKNIITFSPETRPYATIEEHNEALVEKWNSVVRPKDVVWHLGDVAFGKVNLKYISRCNGNKHLVMGNHDTYQITDYIDAGFSRIVGVIRYKEFILSHVPLHISQMEHRWRYNIHGHIHNPKEYDLADCYINVNADAINCTPISLDQVRQIVERRAIGRTTSAYYE